MKSNLNIYELGTGISFKKNSTSKAIHFKRRFLFTHSDKRWETKPDKQSFYKELIEIDLHSISHIDSLNHIAVNRTGYNGVKYDGDPTNYPDGAQTLPLIKGSALMLDIPRFLKVEYLNEKQEIDSLMIKNCLEYQNTKIEDFDILLIRTGHIRYLKDRKYAKYYRSEIGLSVDAIFWLSEKNIKVIGADNFAVESIPTKPNSYSEFYPGHKKFITEQGILVIENLDFEELSNHNINEFYFVAAPIRITNASAALVNPIALVNI